MQSITSSTTMVQYFCLVKKFSCLYKYVIILYHGLLGHKVRIFGKIPILTNCSQTTVLNFSCFDLSGCKFLVFRESIIVTSTKPSSKLMDCDFSKAPMVCSAQVLWWGVRVHQPAPQGCQNHSMIS